MSPKMPPDPQWEAQLARTKAEIAAIPQEVVERAERRIQRHNEHMLWTQKQVVSRDTNRVVMSGETALFNSAFFNGVLVFVCTLYGGGIGFLFAVLILCLPKSR